MASRKRTAKRASSIPVSGTRILPERVSQTTMKLPLGGSFEPVTAERELLVSEVPASGLDRLLALAIDMPLDGGEDGVVRAVVDTLAAILPAHAVGACFVTADGQRVYRRLPSTGDLHDGRHAMVDPTRLFPTFAKERVLDVGGAASGSTLHVASDDLHGDDGGPDVHLARRASYVLARGIELARVTAEAQAQKKELIALESRAIQADKLASFGQIAAGLVHELNNPLTSIVAYSDYLVRGAVGRHGGGFTADDIERLRRIGESANRMLRFTRDLVSYARPSSELAVPVSLHAVIDQAIAFCEHVAAAAGATIERRYDDEVRTLRGMPEQLTQVFVNLLTNACQALPEIGGRIVVETRALAGGRRVAIVLADNGHGIAASELPHIFQPFFTTKREGGGTGLGLSIVKSIVERHAGTIHVESKKPGGTRFVIELPVR